MMAGSGEAVVDRRAYARCETLRPGRMAMRTEQTVDAASRADDGREPRQAARAMWAMGDYHRFATELVWGFGPELVAACGISRGQRVLDVAAGSGNVAIRAAEAGAQVVASDLTPENLAAGRRAAEARGLAIEWVEADAEELPFADASFDVVTSSVGAIFAPDHAAVAGQLLRVCRPGGTIGMLNFTPEGLGGEFFELFGRFAPPPASGAQPVTAWGSEPHVRCLFGERVSSLEMTRKHASERMAGAPEDYVDFYKATFGPVVALYASLAGQPDRVEELDRAFLDFAVRANRGARGGPVEYAYEILVVVARKRA
jgi:2-polyprenyl-6-hydroxyphenyl methylase/3-demethylubiquinone-9 3-methyltransferase